MKNEYCDHIAYVLQNFERYDQRAFRKFGGYLAYIALDVLESCYGLTPLAPDRAGSEHGDDSGDTRAAGR